MTGPRSSAHRARALRPRFLALLPPRSAFRLSSDDTTRTGRVQHDIRGMTSLQNIIAKQPSFAHLMLSTKQVPQRRPAVVQNLCSAAPTVDANCIVGERCKRASRPLGPHTVTCCHLQREIGRAGAPNVGRRTRHRREALGCAKTKLEADASGNGRVHTAQQLGGQGLAQLSACWPRR